MTSDGELLRRYTETNSEEAFSELVGRHLDLVYSAALRQVNGDAHLAQDAAQTVFADLARKAASLAGRPALTGWLYTSAHYAAAKMVRTEQRRHTREQEAHAMRQLLHEPGPNLDWETLRPVLDTAMHELNEADREVILMRYFENRQHAEIGVQIGLSENSARMRVERALEKLRTALSRRGVTTTAALSAALSANAVTVAPAGLAATITAAAALAGTTIATTATTTVAKAIAMTTLQKTLITTIVVAGVATPWVIQRQAQLKLGEENQSLRQQIAQLQTENKKLSGRLAHARSSLVLKLPAPPVRPATPPTGLPPEEATATNLYARLNGLKDNSARLTPEQVASYLNTNRRSAASLLAAYRTTRDPALLEEAMQRYPDDPLVAFEAAFKKDGASEERRQWLEVFKKSASDNALPNYLSALDYFKAGRADQAVQELIAASGKQRFQDYTLDRLQDDEEAYLAAGYPVAEAKTIPAWQTLLPQLRQIKDLSQYMIDLANSYRQAGDQASEQAALQMAANLGQRYGNPVAGEPEISRLVGLAVERNALNAMDPNSPYGEGGQTVKDRLDYLAQQSAQIKKLGQQTEALLPMMSDQDWISYKDRWRVFGEEAAGKWLINKYGQQ
jgi:RNA polymerase sigma factor (sigma-70 family)